MSSIILDRENTARLTRDDLAVTPRHREAALRNLARVLKGIPRKSFNLKYEILVRGSISQLQKTAKNFGNVKLGTCGAIACAYGWAGADSWFRARGLKSEVSFNGTYIDENVKFGHPTNGSAMIPQAWFGLTDEEGDDLFGIGWNQHNTTQTSSLVATRQKVKLLIKKYSGPAKRRAAKPRHAKSRT